MPGEKRSASNSHRHMSSGKERSACDMCRAAKAKCHMSQGGCSRCISLGASCQCSTPQHFGKDSNKHSNSEGKRSEFSRNVGPRMPDAHSSSSSSTCGSDMPDMIGYEKGNLQYAMDMIGSDGNMPIGHYGLDEDSPALMSPMQYDPANFDAFASNSNFGGYDQHMQSYLGHPTGGMPAQSNLPDHIFDTESRGSSAGHNRKATSNTDCRQQALDVLASLH